MGAGEKLHRLCLGAEPEAANREGSGSFGNQVIISDGRELTALFLDMFPSPITLVGVSLWREHLESRASPFTYGKL